jgi:transposase InsO family protein
MAEQQEADPVLRAARQQLLQADATVPQDLQHEVQRLLSPKLALNPSGILTYNGLPIIPEKQRASLLRHAHDEPASGHLGVRKTQQRLLSRAWWPNIREDVRDWVTSCLVCQQRKGPREAARAPLVQQPVPTLPWQRVQVDIKGPLPATATGHKYVLCCIDMFSKWIEAVPLQQIDARTVAEAVVTQVALRHGVPQVIHTDQGRQFESEIFKHVCQLLGAEKTRTSPFHPSGNGGVERFNRTLGDMLAAFCSENQDGWDRLLPYVVWAYNTAEHRSTGASPFRILRGIEPRLPTDLLLGDVNADVPQSCLELQRNIRNGFEAVTRNLKEAQRQQQRRLQRQGRRVH